VPECFNADFLLRIVPTVSLETNDKGMFPLNFRVGQSLLQLLRRALLRSRTVPEYGRERHCDLAGENCLSSTSLVLRLGKKLRGFSEANLSDLNEFYELRTKIDAYRRDEVWLTSDGDAQALRIPYLAAMIEDSIVGVSVDEEDVLSAPGTRFSEGSGLARSVHASL
jgi:hypothetical protein